MAALYASESITGLAMVMKEHKKSSTKSRATTGTFAEVAEKQKKKKKTIYRDKLSFFHFLHIFLHILTGIIETFADNFN